MQSLTVGLNKLTYLLRKAPLITKQMVLFYLLALKTASKNQGSKPNRWAIGQTYNALIKTKINLEKRDQFGRTALHVAAEWGNTEVLKKLIAAGAMIDSPIAKYPGDETHHNRFKTPLHLACYHRQYDAALILLNAGANPHVLDAYKNTAALCFFSQLEPCHFINRTTQKKIVDVMDQFHAKNINFISAVDEFSGDTLFHILVEKNHELLLSRMLKYFTHAEVNVRNNYCATPLQIAIQKNQAKSNYSQTIRLLLEAGAIVDDPLHQGWKKHTEKPPSALHIAILKNDIDEVTQLIEAKADVDYRCYNGQTAMAWAAGFNRIEIIKLLLQADAKIITDSEQPALDKVDDSLSIADSTKFKERLGLMPLEVATMQMASVEAMQLLLNHATSNAFPIEKLTFNRPSALLNQAVKNNFFHQTKLLLEFGYKVTDLTLKLAIDTSCSEATLTVLLKYINNPKALNDLILATNDPEKKIHHLLIPTPAEFIAPLIEAAEISTHQSLLATLLISAINHHDLKAVQLLLSYHADPNFFTKHHNLHIDIYKQKPPLHYACSLNSVSMIKQLVNAGAKLDLEDNLGFTALDYAARNNHIASFEYLTRCSAYIEYLVRNNHPENYGGEGFWRALAYRRQNPQIIQLEQINNKGDYTMQPNHYSLFDVWETPHESNHDSNQLKQNDQLSDFICPITQEIMFDPVIAADGFTYEKEAIERHFQNKNTSPITNEELDSKALMANKLIRSIVSSLLDKNPIYKQDVYVTETLKLQLLQAATKPNQLAEFKSTIEQDRRLLLLPLDSNQTTILQHICEQSSDLIQIYLPELLKQLDETDWLTLMKFRPPQYWLKTLASACESHLSDAKDFYEQLQKALNINIDPQNMALYAIDENHLPLFKLATQCLPNINMPIDCHYNTLLHLVALKGHTEMVKYLALADANLKIKNADQLKPEAIAKLNNHIETADTIALYKIAPSLKRLGIFNAGKRIEHIEKEVPRRLKLVYDDMDKRIGILEKKMNEALRLEV